MACALFVALAVLCAHALFSSTALFCFYVAGYVCGVLTFVCYQSNHPFGIIRVPVNRVIYILLRLIWSEISCQTNLLRTSHMIDHRFIEFDGTNHFLRKFVVSNNSLWYRVCPFRMHSAKLQYSTIHHRVPPQARIFLCNIVHISNASRRISRWDFRLNRLSEMTLEYCFRDMAKW